MPAIYSNQSLLKILLMDSKSNKTLLIYKNTNEKEMKITDTKNNYSKKLSNH